MRKFLLVWLIILSASCAVNNSAFPTSTTSPAVNNLGDGGFVSHKPCGPPCFYGIIPGTSIDVDVEQVRQNLSNVFSDCKTFDNSSSGAGRGLICSHGVGVAYDKQLVEGVGFSPWENITVQDVIEKYGTPDQVNVIFVSLPDNPFRTSVNLSYDRLFTILALPEQDGREYVITPSTKILQIAYYAESKYQDIRDATSRVATAWRGFGTYLPVP